MNKDQAKKKGMSAAQAEREAEIAHRARITASLREQRLKRDAELAAMDPAAVVPKRAPRQKAS